MTGATPATGPSGAQPDHRRGADRGREHRAAHLPFAVRQGQRRDRTELIEAITHLAFYAGWPKAFSAMSVARQVFHGN
jgi:hypothetical protein